jgi:predicted phosphoribosyltransferase
MEDQRWFLLASPSGTLVVRGIIKPEDAELAIAMVEEELGVWLAIKKFNERN